MNHQRWPAVIAQDVQKHVHSLKSTVYQVKGQVNGQTVLPMPVGVEKVEQAEIELIERYTNTQIYCKCIYLPASHMMTELLAIFKSYVDINVLKFLYIVELLRMNMSWPKSFHNLKLYQHVRYAIFIEEKLLEVAKIMIPYALISQSSLNNM